MTVSNPYVLPEMASSYIGGSGHGSGGGKHDVVYVARPSAAQPSFAPSGAAPSPDEISVRHLRPPHPMMPTRLWRQRFLANFIQLRAVSLPSPLLARDLLGLRVTSVLSPPCDGLVVDGHRTSSTPLPSRPQPTQASPPLSTHPRTTFPSLGRVSAKSGGSTSSGRRGRKSRSTRRSTQCKRWRWRR